MREDVLRSRTSTAASYLSILARITDSSWEDSYSQYCDNRLSVPHSLALAHPRFYEDLCGSDAVRSVRNFVERASSRLIGCESDRLWQYKCPYVTCELEADHLFPYSYGGPTDSRNRIWLCREHNAFKGLDVHLFPWEVQPVPWLTDVLRRVFQLRRTALVR